MACHPPRAVQTGMAVGGGWWWEGEVVAGCSEWHGRQAGRQGGRCAGRWGGGPVVGRKRWCGQGGGAGVVGGWWGQVVYGCVATVPPATRVSCLQYCHVHMQEEASQLVWRWTAMVGCAVWGLPPGGSGDHVTSGTPEADNRHARGGECWKFQPGGVGFWQAAL